MDIFLLVLASLIIIIIKSYNSSFGDGYDGENALHLFIFFVFIMLPVAVLAHGFITYYLLVTLFGFSFTFGQSILISLLFSLLTIK